MAVVGNGVEAKTMVVCRVSVYEDFPCRKPDALLSVGVRVRSACKFVGCPVAVGRRFRVMS